MFCINWIFPVSAFSKHLFLTKNSKEIWKGKMWIEWFSSLREHQNRLKALWIQVAASGLWLSNSSKSPGEGEGGDGNGALMVGRRRFESHWPPFVDNDLNGSESGLSLVWFYVIGQMSLVLWSLHFYLSYCFPSCLFFFFKGICLLDGDTKLVGW